MSLLPTSSNGPFYSFEDFAKFAIGANKVVGEHGFAYFNAHEWDYSHSYTHINRFYPALSSSSALPEMTKIRSDYSRYIVAVAKELDQCLGRMAKMELEISEVIERKNNP